MENIELNLAELGLGAMGGLALGFINSVVVSIQIAKERAGFQSSVPGFICYAIGALGALLPLASKRPLGVGMTIGYEVGLHAGLSFTTRPVN